MTEQQAKMPWYRMFPNDYAADEHVVLMTLEAEGAYRRLLDHQWRHGTIPSDVRALAAICKNTPVPRMRALWLSIAPCFHPVDGDPSRLQNRRMERERLEAGAHNDLLSERGLRGAEARWGKPAAGSSKHRPSNGRGNAPRKPDAVAEPVLEQCLSMPQAMPADAQSQSQSHTQPQELQDQPPVELAAPTSTVGDAVVLSAPVQGTPGTVVATIGPKGRVRRPSPLVLNRSGKEIVEKLAADLQAGVPERRRRDEVRATCVELVFAYWTSQFKHPNALLDAKRARLIATRLEENGNDVGELLYVIDGARKDKNLMGENEHNRKYDGVETLFRDRGQVERLAVLAQGYRQQIPHGLVTKYAASLTPDANTDTDSTTGEVNHG